jgi:hypothetical protein
VAAGDLHHQRGSKISTIGGPLKDVQEVAATRISGGHTNLRTTQRFMGSQELVGSVARVRVIAEGESWSVHEVRHAQERIGFPSEQLVACNLSMRPPFLA